MLAANPVRFFEILDAVGALDVWFPELAAMRGVPQRPDHHAEGDVWVHTRLVLEKAVVLCDEYNIQEKRRIQLLLAVVWHDVGKTQTPSELLWDEEGKVLGRHHGHESKSRVMPVLEQVFNRFLVPKSVRQLTTDVAINHLRIHRLTACQPLKL